jgi:hypothetical protein
VEYRHANVEIVVGPNSDEASREYRVGVKIACTSTRDRRKRRELPLLLLLPLFLHVWRQEKNHGYYDDDYDDYCCCWKRVEIETKHRQDQEEHDVCDGVWPFSGVVVVVVVAAAVMVEERRYDS